MTEAIAGAHNNLANLAISRGDRHRASHHYREALNAFEKIGHSAGRSIALMNLAILAIESGDAPTAVRKAEKACARCSKHQAIACCWGSPGSSEAKHCLNRPA